MRTTPRYSYASTTYILALVVSCACPKNKVRDLVDRQSPTVPSEDFIHLWQLLRRDRDRLPDNQRMPAIAQQGAGRKPKDRGDCEHTDTTAIPCKKRILTQQVKALKTMKTAVAISRVSGLQMPRTTGAPRMTELCFVHCAFLVHVRAVLPFHGTVEFRQFHSPLIVGVVASVSPTINRLARLEYRRYRVYISALRA